MATLEGKQKRHENNESGLDDDTTTTTFEMSPQPTFENDNDGRQHSEVGGINHVSGLNFQPFSSFYKQWPVLEPTS